MQHMFSIKYSGMLCYLTLGDKHNTNEFFLDPEFFLDLGELPRLESEGELLFEHVAEDPWLGDGIISSSAERMMVGEVHLEIVEVV